MTRTIQALQWPLIHPHKMLYAIVITDLRMRFVSGLCINTMPEGTAQGRVRAIKVERVNRLVIVPG